MPAFIKTEKDEELWARAKNKVREQYSNLSEDTDKFWKLTTSIYKNMSGKNKMRKSASTIASLAMKKLAYVPLTPAAQEAMASQQGGGQMPPQDPSMMGGDPSMQGGQMPPQDPSMMGGEMPQMPIQTVQGPNGEPIDPETGFIVIDPQQGIEQEPTTGILFNKFTGEFMTPEGQPMDPQEAQAMIEEAMASQQGGGQMPPQDPSMMGGDPSMQGGQMPPQDPSMMGGEMPVDPATGAPIIDDQTGLPINPETGYFANLGEQTQQPTSDGDNIDSLDQIMPELASFMERSETQNERQEKFNKVVLRELRSYRNDIQGLRREEEKKNDQMDTALARMENLLDIIENSVLGGQIQPRTNFR